MRVKRGKTPDISLQLALESLRPKYLSGKFKRGVTLFKKFFPLPLIKGKGDTGGWGFLKNILI
jgi:hypothetical protein